MRNRTFTVFYDELPITVLPGPGRRRRLKELQARITRATKKRMREGIQRCKCGYLICSCDGRFQKGKSTMIGTYQDSLLEQALAESDSIVAADEDRIREMICDEPDVLIARLVDDINEREQALTVIEYLVNGADRLAKKVLDRDETARLFCFYLESALAALDDMD